MLNNKMESGESSTITSEAVSEGWLKWPQWKPMSSSLLDAAEKALLACVKVVYEKKYVTINEKSKIWTYIFNKNMSNKTPLILVHGFAGGVGLWSLNLDSLAQNRPVYAFDLLGFGKSSRTVFSSDPESAEEEFVNSIEQWRIANGIDDMILLGHSFGGYLVSSYALKYPDKIKHLILADPWGFPEYGTPDPNKRPIPMWIKAIATLLTPFNPLAIVRAAGPYGPGLIERFRSDLGLKFAAGDKEKGKAAFQYIYQCNAQNPTGESAFHSLSYRFGFARFPMIKRIGNLTSGVPVSFIYGARTWMDKRCGHETQTLLPHNNVEVYSVKAAGHHVYADQPEHFQHIVNTICDEID